MVVEMLTTSASPDRVLEKGKAYSLPKAVAQEFLDGGFAKLPSKKAKVYPVPAQPDPEDTPVEEDEEEDE